MYSIIMPYWQRKSLLLETLGTYEQLYDPSRFEIVIANDGSDLIESDLKGFNLDIKLIHLMKKDKAKNPCVPLNAAASIAQSQLLFITNPEVFHKEPILDDLANAVSEKGFKHYATAAVWSADKNKWYNHTSCERTNLGRAPVPKGAGLHFLAAMHSDFYYQIGGFDEVYREGQGYEDNDFLWKLYENEATFSIHNDLVAYHRGTKTKWPEGGLERNRKIFHEKWEHYL